MRSGKVAEGQETPTACSRGKLALKNCEREKKEKRIEIGAKSTRPAPTNKCRRLGSCDRREQQM